MLPKAAHSLVDGMHVGGPLPEPPRSPQRQVLDEPPGRPQLLAVVGSALHRGKDDHQEGEDAQRQNVIEAHPEKTIENLN